MGFLDGGSIGFGDVSTGGSGGSGSIPANISNFKFIENDYLITSNDRLIASRNASYEEIEFTLPEKTNIEDGAMFEIVNMNESRTIKLKDTQDENIDGSPNIIISGQNNLSFILDKNNNLWKIVYGI